MVSAEPHSLPGPQAGTSSPCSQVWVLGQVTGAMVGEGQCWLDGSDPKATAQRPPQGLSQRQPGAEGK